ncbi:MAG: hypothetical protein AAB553_03910 [Patescibacteria group bacterium]
MQRLLQSLGIASIASLCVVGSAFAQSPSVSQGESSGAMIRAREQAKQMKQDASAKIAGTLQERAGYEITRRITSLETLIERINGFRLLTAAQKSELIAQIQTEIDALKALQSKIEANADTATLREDVKSIVTSYRIYALFMPKIAIIGAGERIMTLTDEMSVLADKLEARIAEAEAAGQDVTVWETHLDTMNANITDAETKAQAAIDAVLPLNPEGYPDNKKTLQEARLLIQQAHQSLVTAAASAKTITQALEKTPQAAGATTSLTSSPTVEVQQ